ncbi:amidohydrolase family protein [Streptomyces sp. NRRL S-813]|uniref:amidohydrolase family protein n=1 Tax=Streptomyces sp. NRRL S-813 TaxID=1463919 RepID=UPI0004BE85E2|nr:amidohydrolase family protein [Streptomyces sp. NRRL S-813]
MIIDSHAHVLPPALPQPTAGADPDTWPCIGPADADGSRLLTAGALRYTARDVFFSAERRIEEMEKLGIDAEVLSPMPPLLNYTIPAKASRDIHRASNEFLASLIAHAPARFHGLGAVPLQDPDLAAAELAELKQLGLRGVEIGTNIVGASLGDARFHGFYAEAERLGLALYVHALSPALGDRLPASATGTYGFNTESSLAAASLVSTGTAEKFPDLRIGFSHGAGGFPLMVPRARYFWGGTWNEEPPVREDRAALSPLDLARRFFYDALVFDARALRYLIDLLGPHQVMLGSDFPAMDRETPADRTLRTLGLTAAEHEAVTWTSCHRFLGLAPQP